MFDFNVTRGSRGCGKSQKYLLMGGYRYPIHIDGIRHYSDEFPTFEGYVVGKPEKVNNLNFEIERVIFNDPATIVIWKDGTKTVVKCQEGDVYDAEKGLALCISKKALGNTGNFNEVFKKWVPQESNTQKSNTQKSKSQTRSDKTTAFLYGLKIAHEFKRLFDTKSDEVKEPKEINLIEELAKVNADIAKNEKELAEIKKKSVEEMREALQRHCDDCAGCQVCPLDDVEDMSCHFTGKGDHLLNDDMIKEAYKLVFSK